MFFGFQLTCGMMLLYYGYTVMKNPRVWGDQGRRSVKAENFVEYAKQNENDTCHNCGNEQSAFAILLDNAINNNNKGTSRTANLYPASSENRDGQTGNNSSDNSFLRSDSRSDAECNGQWQSYDTNNDTGHNV